MSTMIVSIWFFNLEKSISSCLNSIINLTDDIIKKYKSFTDKYNNIIFLKNEKNGGWAYSLDKYLKLAKDYHLAIIAANNMCLSERFEEQVYFLNSTREYQLVGGLVFLNNKTGDKIISNTFENSIKYDLIYNVPFIHSTIMMHRKTYDIITVSNRPRRGQFGNSRYKSYSHRYKGYNMKKPLFKYNESLFNYKKHKIKADCNGKKTHFISYRNLSIPIKYYIFIFKPLISVLTPKRVVCFTHESTRGRRI